MSGRIDARFAALKAEGRAGFVPFVMAGDPDEATSRAILDGLVEAGADLIELGMPFSDPMADGPSIQVAGQRALAAGQTLAKTLDMVRSFREKDADTPIILMGYYNPIYNWGPETFVADAAEAGVDGLIVVDVPAEEDHELCLPAMGAGLNFIRLVAPTTGDERLPPLMKNSSGFVYYVSITGITGTKTAVSDQVADGVARVRKATDLPVAVGFGIRTPERAAEIARVADAAVVGSAIVDRVTDNLGSDGTPGAKLVDDVLRFVADLSAGVRGARG